MLEPRSLDPESSMLTTRLMHLQHAYVQKPRETLVLVKFDLIPKKIGCMSEMKPIYFEFESERVGSQEWGVTGGEWAVKRRSQESEVRSWESEVGILPRHLYVRQRVNICIA